MALNSTSLTSQHPSVLMAQCCRTPWQTYVKPFKMAPGVWYISGNDWVACYLVDTGDGLVLIDTGMHETAYLMLENIRMLGYKPTDIKKILLTHAHCDHIGAARTMKELTGAKLYLGKEDLLFLHSRRDLIYIENYTCGEFEPDELYADDKPITQGEVVFQSMATPGHTPGCTSLFFTVKDKHTGKNLRCGIHGGLGLLYRTKEEFEQIGLPPSLMRDFIAGLQKLDQMEVDVCLPSHTNQVGILPLQEQISEDFNPYDNPSIWHELMQERLQRALVMLEEGNF